MRIAWNNEKFQIKYKIEDLDQTEEGINICKILVKNSNKYECIKIDDILFVGTDDGFEMTISGYGE
jgi:hypothetical protein